MKDIFIIIIILTTSITTRIYLDNNPIQIKEDEKKNKNFSKTINNMYKRYKKNDSQ